MKAIGVLILAVAQACLAIQWLAQMTWHFCVRVPWNIYQDAQRYRAHECPKPETFHAQDAPSPQVSSRENPATEPVGNDDSEEDGCYFCSHAKAAHEDDYLCVWPGCGCEAEQYAPRPTWRPGDPKQYRDRVVNLDGDVTYQKVMA